MGIDTAVVMEAAENILVNKEEYERVIERLNNIESSKPDKEIETNDAATQTLPTTVATRAVEPQTQVHSSVQSNTESISDSMPPIKKRKMKSAPKLTKADITHSLRPPGKRVNVQKSKKPAKSWLSVRKH